MKRFSPFWPIAATLLPLAVACHKKDANPTAVASAAASNVAAPSLGLKLSFEPSAPDQARASELASKVNSATWQFERDSWKPEQDQKATLLLAATSNDGATLGAALASLRTFTKPGTKTDQDILLVAKRQLLSDDHHVAARALALLKPALVGNADLLDEVVKLGETNAYRAGPERYEVLRTLADLSPAERTSGVKSLLLSSLEAPEPPVVIAALKQLTSPRKRAARETTIVSAVRPLLSHADAGVRGYAALVLGQNGKDDRELATALTSALADPHPFVRSQAATALAQLDYKPALHSLLPLTKDQTKNSYDYSFKSFEDHAELQSLQGSFWPHVSAAALEALTRLAPNDAKLQIDIIAPKDVEGSLKKNAKTYASWYAKNKAKLPTE